MGTDVYANTLLACELLFGDLRLRNNLYCVGWGVKLYSLTHSLLGGHAEEKEVPTCADVCR